MYNAQSNIVKPRALTGPPRPSDYCLGKCFGGQKPGSALKNVATNQLMNFRSERESRSTGKVGSWWSFRPRGHLGAMAPRTDPSRPPQVSLLWHVYRSTVFVYNKSTSSSRVAEPHKKAWFTCWGSDHPPLPLPVALTLHFLWARIRLPGVINNHSIEWGKVKFPLYIQKEECLFPPFCCPTS